MTNAVIGTRRYTDEEVAMFRRIAGFLIWPVRLSLASGLPVSVCADTIRNETKRGDYPRTAKRLIRAAGKTVWKAKRRKNGSEGEESRGAPEA